MRWRALLWIVAADRLLRCITKTIRPLEAPLSVAAVVITSEDYRHRGPRLAALSWRSDRWGGLRDRATGWPSGQGQITRWDEPGFGQHGAASWRGGGAGRPGRVDQIDGRAAPRLSTQERRRTGRAKGGVATQETTWQLTLELVPLQQAGGGQLTAQW